MERRNAIFTKHKYYPKYEHYCGIQNCILYSLYNCHICNMSTCVHHKIGDGDDSVCVSCFKDPNYKNVTLAKLNHIENNKIITKIRRCISRYNS